jgi:hypothetical protein
MIYFIKIISFSMELTEMDMIVNNSKIIFFSNICNVTRPAQQLVRRCKEILNPAVGHRNRSFG